MSDVGLLRKDQLESSLYQEKKLIEDGVLKEDNPLDVSEPFRSLCEACRRGDLQTCHEMIGEGANINAKDQYDYTPLILASLCGHYETVQLLLESGALCERDTFQGERCLYNALNDKIRNLLLSYDYSKSTDPLQPLASHITSLLFREQPKTSDVMVIGGWESFALHKFILSARSPYFSKKLPTLPDSTSWKLPTNIPPQSFSIALKHLYLGELPRDLGGGPGTGYTDSEILAGLDRICKNLEIKSLSETVLDNTDRRIARQRRSDEVEIGRDQLQSSFRGNVLRHKVTLPTDKADNVKWDRNNAIYADILLRADEDNDDADMESHSGSHTSSSSDDLPATTNTLGIPLASQPTSRSSSLHRPSRTSTLYPCHKAMLIRSEFFLTMFDSHFREALSTPHLQIIPIDCSPRVMEIILTFLYTESTSFGLDVAVDVLFAADMLFLEKLKTKAAVVISTLGNGTAAVAIPHAAEGRPRHGPTDDVDDGLDIYEILRAAWLTRVQRLEDFAARYIAYRLERYIDDPEFAEIIRESAGRITSRQETDSIELLDDIRYHLSERFRLRFEDTGFGEAEEQVILESRQLEEEQERKLRENGGFASGEAASTEPNPDLNVQLLQASPPPFPPSGLTAADTVTPATRTPQPASTSKTEPQAQTDHPQAYQASPHASSDSFPTAQPDFLNSGIRTLDGELAGDEFAADAINYQTLLAKLDGLLDQLKLDA